MWKTKPNGLQCVICNKDLVRQQTKCCSVGCKDKLNSINKKGVKFTDEHKQNISKAVKQGITEETIKQRTTTIQERYGVEHQMQLDSTKEKIKQTLMDRYGVEHQMQLDSTKEKIKQTCILRYGYEHPMRSIAVRDKIKASILKSHGVEFALQSQVCKLKMQTTMIERYGHTNYAGRNIPKEILNNLQNIEWWRQFSTIMEAYSTIAEYLSCKTVRCYAAKVYPEIIGNGRAVSFPHLMLIQELNELNILFNINDRKTIPGIELDIYVPRYKLAIEINGAYWHSELGGKRGKDYHINKYNLALEQGIKLFQFWDFEIYNKLDIIMSMIKNSLMLSTSVMARKTCVVKSSLTSEIKDFLNNNHLQGWINSSLYYCLYLGDELLCVGSFNKPRYNNEADLELTRFATKIGFNIIGGFSKIISQLKEYSIVSYSNKRWSSGNVYKQNGFVLKSIGHPSYHYTKDYYVLESRIKYQKHKLKDLLEYYNERDSEWTNMRNNGYDRLWDCGSDTWIKHN